MKVLSRFRENFFVLIAQAMAASVRMLTLNSVRS
jgi:hypothetical protein